MPIDSVSHPEMYLVGMYILDAYPDDRDETCGVTLLPYAKFGVEIDRGGTICRAFGRAACRYDVNVGPYHRDVYRRVLDYIARREDVRAAVHSKGSMPLFRVMPRLEGSLDDDIRADIIDMFAVRSIAAKHGSAPDSALRSEIGLDWCDAVRDFALRELGTSTDVDHAQLIKFSRVDVRSIPGHAVVDVYIYPAGMKETETDNGYEITWDWMGVVVLDRAGNVVFSDGQEPICRHP